ELHENPPLNERRVSYHSILPSSTFSSVTGLASFSTITGTEANSCTAIWCSTSVPSLCPWATAEPPRASSEVVQAMSTVVASLMGADLLVGTSNMRPGYQRHPRRA